MNSQGNSNQSYELEIQHAMGYNGNIPKSVILHNNLVEYMYIAGAYIVVTEMNDPNKQSIMKGHDDVVTCMTLSANGKYLATGQKGENSDILVWDYERKKIVYKLSEHDYEVSCLKFSHDDRFLFSCGNIQDKKLFVWDMKNGYIVANCALFPQPTNDVAWGGFVRDERGNNSSNYQFATCGKNVVALWKFDPKKGSCDYQVISTGNFLREYKCLTFSLNEEKYLYVGTTSGDIVCFLVKNRLLVFSKIVCARGVTSIYSVYDNQLLVGGGDGSLTLLYVDEPKCDELMKVTLFGGVFSISPSPDGVQVLASTNNGFIYRVRTVDLSNILLNENHTDAIQAFHSLNDKYYRFGTCSVDGTIRLWNLIDYSVYSRYSIGAGVLPLCLTFRDDLLISGWSDGKVRCLNTSNSELLWSIDNCHKTSVTAMCLSNNNKFICTGGDLGEVRIWEIRSKEMVINLKEHISKVTKVHVFNNDIHLLTSAKDRSLLIWDLEKEKRIFSYNLNMGGCNNFSINPIDEQMMISIGQDRKITQWDLRQPKPVKSISSHPYGKADLSDELFALAWSHDGKYISTGGNLGIVRTWDAYTLGFMGENFAHSKTCTSLSYTFDDKYLISCGADAQILSFAIKH